VGSFGIFCSGAKIIQVCEPPLLPFYSTGPVPLRCWKRLSGEAERCYFFGQAVIATGSGLMCRWWLTSILTSSEAKG
jgi:hypothetical protein